MISEKKDIISEDMIERVLSGKIDTSGLLKHKKSDYNDIAVNKLLNVLQKENPEKREDKEVLNDSKDEDDDDWIGEDNSLDIPHSEKNIESKNPVTNTKQNSQRTTNFKKPEQIKANVNIDSQSETYSQIKKTKTLEEKFIPIQALKAVF